ncbi:hypothetical protein KMW28_27205 [Flammeovirga yaeyamensis]|uniref:Uncharacterized protein n=1 Tax=Flammeovirga yaeyamensis TaxID=367791 RepID=A0AAX1NAJ6_9BACT|nr:hypothetical protein [Flammeovirga yaeyamensis]MBB3700031.1 hypothetical protein [Flammeovirga yaeyamensis]NMF37532.1 hypothetical protein [Flammeovirga yaeyamensis]QWG04589.1 hypothetical protein KMW28_27205 [Flammeovirga yaeyamensis]
MEDKAIQIKLSTLQGVLNYLAQQKYADVAGIISTINQEIQPQLAEKTDESK